MMMMMIDAAGEARASTSGPFQSGLVVISSTLNLSHRIKNNNTKIPITPKQNTHPLSYK